MWGGGGGEGGGGCGGARGCGGGSGCGGGMVVMLARTESQHAAGEKSSVGKLILEHVVGILPPRQLISVIKDCYKIKEM